MQKEWMMVDHEQRISLRTERVSKTTVGVSNVVKIIEERYEFVSSSDLYESPAKGNALSQLVNKSNFVQKWDKVLSLPYQLQKNACRELYFYLSCHFAKKFWTNRIPFIWTIFITFTWFLSLQCLRETIDLNFEEQEIFKERSCEPSQNAGFVWF